LVEDANGRQERVTFWEDDYERFKEELEFWESDTRMGNLLKMRVKAPEGPYRTFTFESPPRHLKHKIIPKYKIMDCRLIVMDRPKKS
jgi:hypothetical protein